MIGLKEFSVTLELKDVNLHVMAILFGPTFWDWLCGPQIEEWENEGGAIR